MPETNPHSEGDIENDKDVEIQKAYEIRMGQVQKHLERLFDDCKEKGTDPIDELMSDDQELIRKAFGDARIDELFISLRQIPQVEKEQFCAGVIEAAHFLFYDRYFNPDVKQFFDEADAERQQRLRIEKIRFGTLTATIHQPDSQWLVELKNEQYIKENDRVLEISWPEDQTPQGIRDIKDSFRQMGAYVEDHPEIKAVVAVSWMMSRGAAHKLGFTNYPDVRVEHKQIDSILSMVEEARKDKPKYEKDVTEKDVMFGAIDREEFIRRYANRS